MFDALASFEAPNVFNPWSHWDPLDASPFSAQGRLDRLKLHFDCAPNFLLIGEAPGYQGCHFSGVPFTNESLLCAGVIPRIDMGGQRITTRPRPWCEPSATIVWRTLHSLGIAASTVMWNAFAFHPHKPAEPMSNRAPTDAELVRGSDVLRAVTDRFRGAHVIAVGRVAEKALRRLGVGTNGSVRHPSMGGANEFRAGLAAIVAKRLQNNASESQP